MDLVVDAEFNQINTGLIGTLPWVIFYLVPNALSRQSPIIWVEKDHDLSNDDAVKYHQS